MKGDHPLMKRFLLLLLALAVLPFAAFAADASEPVSSAMANLTEVFGYTLEEAEAFAFDITENDTAWTVAYYEPGHPTWVYTLIVDKATGRGVSGDTPFKGPDYVKYPGENAVRGGLRAARENGWFADLSAENRAAFLQWMEQWGGVRANDMLKKRAGGRQHHRRTGRPRLLHILLRGFLRLARGAMGMA